MSSLGFALLRLLMGLRNGLRDAEFRAILLLLLLAIIGATVFYATEEGWDWIDAAYFSVITLATVSDPRFVPNSPRCGSSFRGAGSQQQSAMRLYSLRVGRYTITRQHIHLTCKRAIGAFEFQNNLRVLRKIYSWLNALSVVNGCR